MLLKINIATWISPLSIAVERFWHRRAILLLARFPMLAILGASASSIALHQSFGIRWMLGLAIVFGIAASTILLGWMFRKSADSDGGPNAYGRLLGMLVAMLGVGLVMSVRHEFQSRLIRQTLASHASLRHASNPSDPKGADEPGPWKPVAVRGTVEEQLRYRQTNRPSLPQPIFDSTIPSRDARGTMTDRIGWQTLSVIHIQSIRNRDGWVAINLWMPISIDGKIKGFLPGDQVELYCHWRAPSEPSNPGQFDSSKRYAELGYHALGKLDSENQIRQHAPPDRWRIDRCLANVSASALQWIDEYVVLDQSRLAAALVIGQREQVEWNLQEELLATGTIHMLSISGMHIEMVALSLWILGTYLRVHRRALLIAVVLVVGAYALLCGANPPVARASLMLLGLCIARWMGWQFSSLNVLACAGVLLLWYRTTIAFEVGTQLSFLAVAVLILSIRSNRSRKSPLEQLIDARSSQRVKGMRACVAWSMEMLRSSFWVWFITAPLVWSGFHVISPIAIAMNLVLWVPMFVALLSGLALVALGWIPPIGIALGALCGGSLWIVEALIGLGETVPGSHVWMAPPPAWWVYGFYALGLIMAAIQGVRRDVHRRWLLGSLGLWFAVGLALSPLDWIVRRAIGSDSRQLAITFVDVGHGTSVFIEAPDHQRWLYDAGRMGDDQRSYLGIANALWGMQCSRLDGIIVSHADADHYNAVPGIVQRFHPREFVTTKQVVEHQSPHVKAMLAHVHPYCDQETVWSFGDTRLGTGWSMRTLHPPEKGVVGSDNANSLCLLIEFGGCRILLPGDLEPPGMQALSGTPRQSIDVLMAPHHGSVSAKSDLLLEWCQPKLVVISGAHRALSKRVLDPYRSDGRQVFVTARDHAVRIEIASDGSAKALHWVQSGWQPLSP